MSCNYYVSLKKKTQNLNRYTYAYVFPDSWLYISDELVLTSRNIILK